MAGMTSMLSRSLCLLDEVPDHPEARLARLLRVELDAPRISFSDRGGEGAAVGRRGDGDALARLGRERVDVVHVRTLGEAREERLAVDGRKRVPADLRELRVVEPPDGAVDVAQPLCAGRLVALLEEELHPEAHP